MSPNSALRLALRASRTGAALAGAILFVVLLTALVPSDLRGPCVAGYALALITTALGNLVLAHSLFDNSAGSGTRLVRALVVDLALHVVVGGGTALTLFLLRTKFLAAVAFALAFAAAVIVMRITGAIVLARPLKSSAPRTASEQSTE